jgi:hypothetical protein
MKRRAGSESPRSRPTQPTNHQHWRVRLRQEFLTPPPKMTATNSTLTTTAKHPHRVPLQMRQKTPPQNMATSPTDSFNLLPPPPVPRATPTEPRQTKNEPLPIEEDILAISIARQALALRLAKKKGDTEMIYLLASARLESTFPNIFHPKTLTNYHKVGDILEHRRKTYVETVKPFLWATTTATRRSTPKKVTTFTPAQIAIYRRATLIIRLVTAHIERQNETELEDGEIMDEQPTGM